MGLSTSALWTCVALSDGCRLLTPPSSVIRSGNVPLNTLLIPDVFKWSDLLVRHHRPAPPPSTGKGYWRLMSLLVTDLGYISCYRRRQALSGSQRGCTVSPRRGPGVSTQPYRINTPATSKMRSNEGTLAAPVRQQQAKCSLSGSHLSAGIEVLALESIPSLVTSWQITLWGPAAQSDTFQGLERESCFFSFFLEMSRICFDNRKEKKNWFQCN